MAEPEKPAWKVQVTFGEADASDLVVNLTTNSSINNLATAELWLRLESMTKDPLDLFSEVRIQAMLDGTSTNDLFTGSAVAVQEEGDVVHLSLRSGPTLTEKNPSPRWSHGVDAAEQIYTLVREAGFPHERTRISGLESIEAEPMLVVAPIVGLVIDEQVAVGDVTFVPSGEAVKLYAARSVDDLVYRPLVATEVHAVYATTAALLRDAETEGLHEIDVVLAYLKVTCAYGLLQRPDGTVQPFQRDRARSQPRRGEVVAVEALSTGRCWVRVPEDRTPAFDLLLGQSDLLVLGHQPTLAEQQALIAWRRAATEQDSVAQAVALSDALEFYAAGVAGPDMFDEDEIKALLASLPELAVHKGTVVRETIRRLNAAPLKQRIREAARRDDVPLTGAEIEFLWKRIRSARNSAVHGKGASPPSLYEIERALSIVGRLLVYRLTKSPPADQPEPAIA